jgi:hypothetical protein
MSEEAKTPELLKRLLETTQDLFIFQGLQAGLKGDAIKSLLRVNTDRVTRVSKLMPRKGRNAER